MVGVDSARASSLAEALLYLGIILKILRLLDVRDRKAILGPCCWKHTIPTTLACTGILALSSLKPLPLRASISSSIA